MGLFTAGQPLPAAQLNAINGYVLKTADQSVTSSTTLANDTHLSYAIAAAGTYVFDAYLYGVSIGNNTGNLRAGFSFPAGTLHFSGIAANTLTGGVATATDFNAALSASSGVTAEAYALSTTATGYRIHGILIATAAGTLRLMWAQNVSHVDTSTLKAGSHMLVRQVA